MEIRTLHSLGARFSSGFIHHYLESVPQTGRIFVAIDLHEPTAAFSSYRYYLIQDGRARRLSSLAWFCIECGDVRDRTGYYYGLRLKPRAVVGFCRTCRREVVPVPDVWKIGQAYESLLERHWAACGHYFDADNLDCVDPDISEFPQRA